MCKTGKINLATIKQNKVAYAAICDYSDAIITLAQKSEDFKAWTDKLEKARLMLVKKLDDYLAVAVDPELIQEADETKKAIFIKNGELVNRGKNISTDIKKAINKSKKDSLNCIPGNWKALYDNYILKCNTGSTAKLRAEVGRFLNNVGIETPEKGLVWAVDGILGFRKAGSSKIANGGNFTEAMKESQFKELFVCNFIDLLASKKLVNRPAEDYVPNISAYPSINELTDILSPSLIEVITGNESTDSEEAVEVEAVEVEAVA